MTDLGRKHNPLCILWMSSLDEGIETALKLSSDIKLGSIIDIAEGRPKT